MQNPPLLENLLFANSIWKEVKLPGWSASLIRCAGLPPQVRASLLTLLAARSLYARKGRWASQVCGDNGLRLCETIGNRSSVDESRSDGPEDETTVVEPDQGNGEKHRFRRGQADC